jgi:hypothetical protein
LAATTGVLGSETEERSAGHLVAKLGQQTGSMERLTF